MRFRWIAAGVVCLALVAAYAAWRWWPAAPPPERVEHQLWVPACRPIGLRRPLEVVRIGEQGERGLYSAPSSGLVAGGDGGEAVFRFYIPTAGRYRIWGYCCWLEGGKGGFGLSVGGLERRVTPDGPKGAWMWLPMGEAELAQGVVRMTLTADGDGFAVRRFFVCNDIERFPLDSTIEPRDIFYDDFDGCAEGEFDTWAAISGDWRVRRLRGADSGAMKALVVRSTSGATIDVGDGEWRNYTLMVDCRTIEASPQAEAGVRFYRDAEGNWFSLNWIPAVAEGGQVQMALLRQDAGAVRVLDRFVARWDPSQWNELTIDPGDRTMTISVNALPIRTVEVGAIRGGSIGLSVYGEAEIMYDNVQVRGRRVRAGAATRPAPVEATPDAVRTERYGWNDGDF